MKDLSYGLLLACCLVGCRPSTTTNQTADVSQASAEQTASDELYFSDALIYEYASESGEKGELWFYVNPETGLVLYVPNDEMVKGVVSAPDGSYTIYGADEHGDGITSIVQKVEAVAAAGSTYEDLAPLPDPKILPPMNSRQQDLVSKGYHLKYLKMEGGETFYATTQIPINSYQLYGFCRLDGDSKLPVAFDFIGIVGKDQTVTNLAREGFKMDLINFESNPYYLSIK
jgi:hypothetical protein